MQIICLEDEALLSLVRQVVDRLKAEASDKSVEWIDGAEAKRLLNIKSNSALQGLRDNGRIRFSHPSKKVILYYKPSIFEYLEKHSKNTF